MAVVRGTPDLWVGVCPNCGTERYFTRVTAAEKRCSSCPTAPGVILDHNECLALAYRLAANQVANGEWIDWGDVPALDEQSWLMLVDALDDVVSEMRARLRILETGFDIDSAYLHERAS